MALSFPALFEMELVLPPVNVQTKEELLAEIVLPGNHLIILHYKNLIQIYSCAGFLSVKSNQHSISNMSLLLLKQ